MGNISKMTAVIHNEMARLKSELEAKEAEAEMLKKVVVELQKSNVAILNENGLLKKALNSFHSALK